MSRKRRKGEKHNYNVHEIKRGNTMYKEGGVNV